MTDTGRPGTGPRLAAAAGIGAAALMMAACAGDTADTAEWTYAPVAGEAPTEPAQATLEPESRRTGPTAADEPLAERRRPLEPPAGITIPRFVEPERADLPEGEPAPGAIAEEDDIPPAVPRATPRRAPLAAVSPAPALTAPGGQQVVEISMAVEDRSYDRDRISVSPGATVRLTLENRDEMRHNLSLYRSEAAQTALFTGSIFRGPDATRTYEFQAPSEPGEYHFRCDLHPNLMSGTFIVE